MKEQDLPRNARDAWEKAMTVRSKNPHKRHPNRHRRDRSGNIVYRPSYGKNTLMAWGVNDRGEVYSTQHS